MRDAKQLAYHIATGNNTSRHLYDNVALLARQTAKTRVSTRTKQSVETVRVDPAEVQAMEPILDQLVSLLAIDYAPSTTLRDIASVIASESSRTDGKKNALQYTLETHRRQQQEARRTLFDDNPALMTKGYTREIYNPYNTVVAANAIEGKKLVDKGYVKISSVAQDALDPKTGAGQALYVLKGLGMQNRETAALSFTGQRLKGSPLHSTVTPEIKGAAGIRFWKENRVEDIRQARVKEMRADKRLTAQEARDYDPRTEPRGFLAPVFNPSGEVANYRYLMNHESRNNHLERDNDFDTVLGANMASQYDKVESIGLNQQIVESLHAFHTIDIEENDDKARAYVEFSLESEDPKLRDLYRLLPEDTKRYIRKVWGANRMYIRNDVIDMMTGYRNISLADPFGKDPNTRNMAENLFVHMIEKIYGAEAATKVRRAEDKWESAVKLLKDVVVIRNFETFFWNVVSNGTLLFWYGVPPKKMGRWHTEAIDGLQRYQDTVAELTRVQNRLSVYPIVPESAESKTPLAQKVRRLSVQLQRNPVAKLVEAGMFQTILEDIDTETKEGRYQDPFNAGIDKQLDRLPESVRNIGNQLAVGKDTTLYKLLFQGTQMSDFVARYVLFQHLTTRTKKPMDESKALSEVRQAFVNYDAPTHRYLNKANSLGLMMFTKYYLRTQKIIFKLMREAPARALGIGMASKYLGTQSILDSNMLGRLGNNPLDPGAIGLLDAYDEPAPLALLFNIIE